MKTNKLLIFSIFCLVFFLHSVAQKRIEPSIEDIEQATNLKEKFDKDDAIAITRSNEFVTFNFNKKSNKVTVNHNVTEDLINLDDRADIQKYYFYDGESRITDFDIFYKNKKKAYFLVIDEAYTNQGLFHNDSRVKYINIDFPLKGYKYTSVFKEEIDDIKYFTKIYFQDEYPIAYKKIEIEIPNWLEIELKEINFDGYDIKKEVVVNKKSDSKTHIFTVTNISAKYNETSTPGPTYIYPHILILSKSFTKNGQKTLLFNETKDLYNWYKSLTNQLKNDNELIKDKVTELTKDVQNDDEKVKNIYYWVQDNIRYIAFEDGIAGFKPDEATNVFTKKYGDCKGMANLTKQMLLEAGFDARLVWIGTKRIAYDYSTPSLSVDNHMICALVKDGKTTFLDATEKFNPFGEYAHRIQGKQALIENGDDFILKTVPNKNVSFNNEIINYNFTLENEDLVGNSRKEYHGERRTDFLYNISNTKNDKKEESLKKYLNHDNINLKVSNIDTSDLDNRDASLKISYDLTIKNAVSSFDNEIYVNLDFDKELASYNFKERKLDFVFSSKKMLESTTNLTIPNNYKISKLPEDILITSKNYDLSVRFSQQANIISYKKEFSIKNAVIETSDFEEWNDFNTKLNKIYNEQIILIKQ